MKLPVKNGSKTIGYIEEVSYRANVFNERNQRAGEIKGENGKLIAFNARGTRIGEYDPNSDVTRDAHSKQIGKGNLLSVLILQQDFLGV